MPVYSDTQESSSRVHLQARPTARDVRAMSLPSVLRFLCATQEEGELYELAALQAAQARVRRFADQMEADDRTPRENAARARRG